MSAIINCSFYDSGQGAFRNGMHDHIGRIRPEDNLYRDGIVRRALWTAGWVFQALTGAGYVLPLNQVRRGS